MSHVKERRTELCKQDSGEEPSTYKRTLLHAAYCAASAVLIAQIADFNLWLPARNVCLFSPSTISVRSMTPLLRNFSINFQRKAERTDGLEDGLCWCQCYGHVLQKARSCRQRAPKLFCIFCRERLCLHSRSQMNLLRQTSEPFVLKVLFTRLLICFQIVIHQFFSTWWT